MRGLAADRAKVITACATLARTSWHVDDEEMAEVMRQHCCVARDAVDRMQERIRKAEAENARLREAGDEMRDALDEGACPECTRHDLAGAWDEAKRGTHG